MRPSTISACGKGKGRQQIQRLSAESQHREETKDSKDIRDRKEQAPQVRAAKSRQKSGYDLATTPGVAITTPGRRSPTSAQLMAIR